MAAQLPCSAVTIPVPLLGRPESGSRSRQLWTRHSRPQSLAWPITAVANAALCRPPETAMAAEAGPSSHVAAGGSS